MSIETGLKNRVILTLLSLFVAGLIITVNCQKPQDNSKVIAQVEDETLTMNELMEEVPPHIRPNLTSGEIREFVLRWINKQVLYQEALERELDQSSEIQKELEKLRKELMINKLMEMTVDHSNEVTKAEIAEYYEANKDRFVLEDDLARAYHIVVPTTKQANEVRKRLKQGESFDTIFKEANVDSLNPQSWDLGYFNREQVIPELSRTIFKMAVGTRSYPIKSEFGYHVVELVDRLKKGDYRRLEMVEDEIRSILEARRKQDKHQRFTLQMKSKFKIETNFQLLESSIMDSLLVKGDGS